MAGRHAPRMTAGLILRLSAALSYLSFRAAALELTAGPAETGGQLLFCAAPNWCAPSACEGRRPSHGVRDTTLPRANVPPKSGLLLEQSATACDPFHNPLRKSLFSAKRFRCQHLSQHGENGSQQLAATSSRAVHKGAGAPYASSFTTLPPPPRGRHNTSPSTIPRPHVTPRPRTSTTASRLKPQPTCPRPTTQLPNSHRAAAIAPRPRLGRRVRHLDGSFNL